MKNMGNIMGKIACECGYIHSDTCGYDGALLTYIEWEDEIDNDDALMVFECPQCGNIMIDDRNDEKMMITYRPKNGKYNKVLHDQQDQNGEYESEQEVLKKELKDLSRAHLSK